MNNTADEPNCQHLVVLTGDASKLDTLCGDGFSFAKALPAPAQIHEADETDVVAFHLLYGQIDEARRISDEIGEPWPFSADMPTTREIRDHLRLNPAVNLAAQRVLDNLRRTGHISARSWKKEVWGHAKDIGAVDIRRLQPEVATLRFTDVVSRLPALLNLALKSDDVQVAAIVVDISKLVQYWFDSATAEEGEAFRLHENRYDNEGDLAVQSWLDHAPEGFSFR